VTSAIAHSIIGTNQAAENDNFTLTIPEKIAANKIQSIYIPNDNNVDHLVDNLDEALAAADKHYLSLHRAAVPKDLLARAKDSTLLRYTLEDWALIFLFWTGMSYSPAWMYPLWALLIGGRIHSFGVILHDATHKSIHAKSWQLRLVEIFAGYTMASTLNAMRYHHIRHHRDSGMPNDPYFKPTVQSSRWIFMLIWARHLLLMPLWIVRGYYGSLAYFFPTMRNSYARVFLQEKSGEDLTQQKELIDCAKAEFGQAFFHTLIFIFTYFNPEMALFYYFIPGTVAGLLGGHRVLVEHNYLPTMDRNIETIIKTTVDHNLDAWGRLFWAPRNIGYHIVHHIHPQVALENLPKLRRWYIENHPELYPLPYNNAL